MTLNNVAYKKKVEDRFIPSRKAMDMDLSRFHLCNYSGENSKPAKANGGELADEYKVNLATALLDAEQNKVLAFSPKSCKNVLSGKGLPSLRECYNTNRENGKMKAATRHIPHTPERILDAPDLLDDFYINVMDWNTNNILAIALSQTVYLWNASTGSIVELMHVEDPEDYICSVAWVNKGNLLAVGTSLADVQIWDTEKQKVIRSMKGHTGRVSSLAWNGNMLSTGSKDSTIMNHDVRNERSIVSTWKGHQQEVCGLKWSPDSSSLASGGNDNLLNIWDINKCAARHTFTDHNAAVKALAWSPHTRGLLASGGGTSDRTIKFWNANTGALLNSIDTKSQVCALEWSKHEKELVSSHGFSQNQLILWKYPTLTKMAELTGHTARVLHLAQSPDGTTVVSAAADETLRFWKLFSAPNSQNKRQKKFGEADGMRLSIR